MKKLYFALLVFITFLLIGCNTPYFTGNFEYTIRNNSSVTINLIVEDTNAAYTVAPYNKIKITKNNHDDLLIVGKPRVTMTRDVREYTISDIPFRTITIWNPQTNAITLYELNGMLGDNFGDSVTIQPNDTVTTKLYTSTPSFMAKYTLNGLNADVSLLSIN